MFTLLFADDTAFQMSAVDIDYLLHKVNEELSKASVWFQSNKLTLNTSKTKFMILKKRSMSIPNDNLRLAIGKEEIERVGDEFPTKHFKFLGLLIDEHLSWAYHVDYVHGKISSGSYVLARAKHLLPSNIKMTIYNSLIKPHLEYGLLTWGGLSDHKLNKLLIVQKKAIRSVAGKPTNTHTAPLFASFEVLRLRDLFHHSCAIFMYQYINNYLPDSFENMFHPLTEPNRTNSFRLARPGNSFLEKFPDVLLPKIWNSLDADIKATNSYSSFKKTLKKSYFFFIYLNIHNEN